MNEPVILFFGEGHGAHAAYRSLINIFKQVYVLQDVDVKLDALVTDRQFLVPSFTTLQFDLAVTAGYRPLIAKETLQRQPIINIHYALLPRFRGLHSLVWAILNDEPQVGLTVHLVNECFDAGPIIHQHAVDYRDQTAWELMLQFDDYVEANLAKIVNRYYRDEITPRAQIEENACWCARRNYEDCLIDFNLSNRQLHLLFRALVKPYPRPFIRINDQDFAVTQYFLTKRNYHVPTARVLNVDQQGAWIKTREGFLVVQELTDQNEQAFPASDILKLGMRLSNHMGVITR